GRPVQAADRLRQRPHLRPRRGHAARRGQGLPPDAAERRGLRRGARASPRARFLQPGLIRPVRVMPGRPVPTMILERPALPLRRDGRDDRRSMNHVFLFSLTAMLNPTLLAATTVLLLLPNPKKLMLGYLLGAMLMSITLGLVIVF